MLVGTFTELNSDFIDKVFMIALSFKIEWQARKLKKLGPFFIFFC